MSEEIKKDYWKEKDLIYRARFERYTIIAEIERRDPKLAEEIKLKELGDYLEEHKDQINYYRKLYHL